MMTVTMTMSKNVEKSLPRASQLVVTCRNKKWFGGIIVNGRLSTSCPCAHVHNRTVKRKKRTASLAKATEILLEKTVLL